MHVVPLVCRVVDGQLQVDRAEERLAGQEADGGRGVEEGGDADVGPLLVFDGDAEPDARQGPRGVVDALLGVVREAGDAVGVCLGHGPRHLGAEVGPRCVAAAAGAFVAKDSTHPGVALGQQLVGVLRSERHDGEHLGDVVVRDVLVERVGEGVDEDLAGIPPAEGIGKAVVDEVDLSAPVDARIGSLGGAGEGGGDARVRVALADAGGSDGVAGVAAGADAVAADDRGPGFVGPFDAGVSGHCGSPGRCRADSGRW